MRADVVVPISEGIEVAIELLDSRDDPLIQLVLQRTKQAFDPAVLPRAAGDGSLVADAKLFERLAENE